MGAETFRSTARGSNFRANIFSIECILVLGIYLYAIQWKTTKVERNENNNNNNNNNIQEQAAHNHHNSSSSPNGTSTATLPLLLSIFGIIYMARLQLMARYILKRELSVEEITFVPLVWVPLILSSFVLLSSSSSSSFAITTAATTAAAASAANVAAVSFYAIGSFLNTYSELERKIWKQKPENKGRCYTEGLFSLSRNVNYFGDTLLFLGWAICTGSLWNLWVPLTMGLSFYYYHIPDKEIYLAKRYEQDWPTYTKNTPYAFIPYIC